ncbi:STAS domain-containing protein, partial [Nocardia abscessus]|uniref:STAS domain-containing protein n=1 Tax=Nocardia abscessus TaxID=120957 RepID=UPI002455224F
MTNTSGDAYPLADTMTTTVAAHDGATVLTVAGEVDLATAPALENAIDAILSGKPAALIVGVGPGLGMSMARRFGREGFRVALVS